MRLFYNTDRDGETIWGYVDSSLAFTIIGTKAQAVAEIRRHRQDRLLEKQGIEARTVTTRIEDSSVLTPIVRYPAR